jgi:hypothetical protein
LSKLLLLGCSQRKKLDEGSLPAIDRYDGPAYRVLRLYIKQVSKFPLDVRILSAKYGLIPASYYLPYYDCRMTKEQSAKLHHQVITELETIFNSKIYTNLLICLGSDYIKTICGYESIMPDGLTVQVAEGGLGRKLSILHDWLYGDSSSLHSNLDLVAIAGVVRLRGIEVNLTSEQVFDIARQAIIKKEQRITQYQSWYVQVDDQRIAPKWLVSKITGLPVSNFVTDEARRVLTQLGVEVKRV